MRHKSTTHPGRAWTCEQCGQVFWSKRHPPRAEWPRFCSRDCANRRIHTPLAERFWSKAEKTEGCWLWQAATNPKGYGLFEFVRGRSKLAHRVAWFLEYGEWPTLNLCHHCDAPACVRPDHLFEGTQADNMQDCVRKGRKPLSTLLTADQVREIRALWAAGGISQPQIASHYGVSRGAVGNAIRRTTWKHVD